MAQVPTTHWLSPYLRRNFPEERSAFVRALGHQDDRSVGGTACSSGPTRIRIGHHVLRLCAHARIGGCARLDNRKTRPGGDAQTETIASDPPSQFVVHGPPRPFVATQPCAGLLAPPLSPRTSLDPSTINGLVNRPPAAVRKGTHPKRRGRAANRRFVALFPISQRYDPRHGQSRRTKPLEPDELKRQRTRLAT
jgi:hypothetical protein